MHKNTYKITPIQFDGYNLKGLKKTILDEYSAWVFFFFL